MKESKYTKYLRLKKKAEEGAELPIGGKATKMGESGGINPFTYKKNKKDASDAYDTLQNIREQEAETALEDYERDLNKQLGYKPDAVKYKKGGMVGSASKRADGCAQRGKTRGKMV